MGLRVLLLWSREGDGELRVLQTCGSAGAGREMEGYGLLQTFGSAGAGRRWRLRVAANIRLQLSALRGLAARPACDA